MKMLFTVNSLRGDYSGRNRNYFVEEVARQTDCKLAGIGYPDYVKGESLKETIKRLYPGDEPDWVAPMEKMYATNSEEIGYNYKIVGWISDIHVDPDSKCATANKYLDILLMCCQYTRWIFPTIEDFRGVFGLPADKFLESGHCISVDKNYFLSRLKIKSVFFPNSVEPSIFKPINESEKKYDVSSIGSVGGFYPFRLKIWNELPELGKKHNWEINLRNAPNIPERREISKIINNPLLRKKWLVGDDYAKALRETKIFISGPGIAKYPVLKYFEVMASRSLLMSPPMFHMDELHFKPDWNFVEVNADNWKEKLVYYLEDDQLRETIARRGYETAVKYHTNEVRAKDFINILDSRLYDATQGELSND